MAAQLNPGIRQGDPISPYLFLLCANILSIALIQAENRKLIKGIAIGWQGVSFTHLLFADDSLFFFQNDVSSLSNLKQIILWYCSLSGQCINFAKSDLYCSPNTPQNEQVNIANSLQVNLVQHPSRYLGINFKLRGRRVCDFQDLVDKVQNKLQGWKARLLCQAGRATLISYVLQSLPLYTFSCFRVPNSVCKKLDTIVWSFWRGHEIGT